MGSDGAFDEIPLPGGIARVEEERYEVMGSYGRPLAANVTMKLSAGGEYSQLAQAGAGGTTRTFYVEGTVDGVEGVAAHRCQRNGPPRRSAQFLRLPRLGGSQDEAGTRPTPISSPNRLGFQRETVRNLGDLGSRPCALWAPDRRDIIDRIPPGTSGERPAISSATVYESNGAHVRARSTAGAARV
jgi:hypothetical protein